MMAKNGAMPSALGSSTLLTATDGSGSRSFLHQNNTLPGCVRQSENGIEVHRPGRRAIVAMVGRPLALCESPCTGVDQSRENKIQIKNPDLSPPPSLPPWPRSRARRRTELCRQAWSANTAAAFSRSRAQPTPSLISRTLFPSGLMGPTPGVGRTGAMRPLRRGLPTALQRWE